MTGISYYELTTRFTDEVTKMPVSAEDTFYQEKQIGGRCSVHSMNAFAGGQVVDIPELFRFNNSLQKEVFTRKGFLGQGQSDTDALKAFGVYLETVQDLDTCGVSHSIVKSFIESNKRAFDLPKDSSMNIVEGSYSVRQRKNPRINQIGRTYKKKCNKP
jgi:hypothetical protein